MSVSRSVQAAQRRRAGPPEPQYQNKNRGPVASINSAQTFNTPHNTNPPINVEKNTKLSIPQAITLITLRLGRLETNLDHISQELVNGEPNHETTDDMKMVDGDVLTNIMNRLEALETSDDNNVLDTVKRGVIQNKTNHTKLRKDFKNLQDKVEDMNLILTSMTMEHEEDVEENEEENVEDGEEDGEEDVEDVEDVEEDAEAV